MGDRSVAPKAGVADTTATGGRTVGVGGVVVFGELETAAEAELCGGVDEVLAGPAAPAVTEPFAAASEVIGVADPVHPASSAAAAIATTVNAIRRTAVTPFTRRCRLSGVQDAPFGPVFSARIAGDHPTRRVRHPDGVRRAGL